LSGFTEAPVLIILEIGTAKQAIEKLADVFATLFANNREQGQDED
jgi:hypothetical protein